MADPFISPSIPTEDLNRSSAVLTPAQPAVVPTLKDLQIEEAISKYTPEISKAALANDVPEEILRGTIRAGLSLLPESKLRGVLEIESNPDLAPYEKSIFDSLFGGGFDNTRVGIGQTTMISTANVRNPNGSASQYLETHYEKIKHELKEPKESIDTLAQVLKANYEFYNTKEGKTVEDQWKFAVAKHLAKNSKETIGEAQETAADSRANGISRDEASNSWSLVFEKLPEYLKNAVPLAFQGVKVEPTTPVSDTHKRAVLAAIE